MEEVVLKLEVPKDLSMEIGRVKQENWQLLFSRFLRAKLGELREIDSIVSKSKATPEQVNELSDEVRSAIAKRFLEK